MNRAHATYRRGDEEREILERHVLLLDRMARRVAARTGWAVTADDLWSAGALGLLDAVRRFDPGRGVRFETFAEHRVRGAMLDELRRMDHLPRRLRGDVDRVEQARRRLGQASGREPSTDELARSLGMEIEQVDGLLQLLQPPMPVEDDLCAPDASSAEERLGHAERRAALAAAVADLPDRLQLVLGLAYDEGLTYREIAKVLGVSEPRVCQLHGEAVKRLRDALEEE